MCLYRLHSQPDPLFSRVLLAPVQPPCVFQSRTAHVAMVLSVPPAVCTAAHTCIPPSRLQSRAADVVMVLCNEASAGLSPHQGGALRAKHDMLAAMLAGSSLLAGHGE